MKLILLSDSHDCTGMLELAAQHIEDNKYDAIMAYAKENGYRKEEILYVGDDFGEGGGDSHVRLGGMDYVEITDYKTLEKHLQYLL